mgnify:CR=1 FL=1
MLPSGALVKFNLVHADVLDGLRQLPARLPS